ncbi:MAG: aminoacyl-tRNA hydrolase [Nitrospiraceae bacterium]|nr:aminoacyl-tRNA hydrolase [Nitrospiraceae bacterium]
MWLVAGLGNPGRKYAWTRHNVGFLVVEEIVDRLGMEFRERPEYRICNGSMGDERLIFLEPLTFMNRSGSAVREIISKNTVVKENLIVIHDDLDLEAGRIKIRKKGSSGGHRGVESIIQHLGGNTFIRVKVGIGRNPLVPTEDYVLSRFRKEELPLIREAIFHAADAVECIITQGPDKAMNTFN